MSQPNRPSFQKPTKSSSSSSLGGPPGGRWNNYSAGVSPVRGLSPVRSTFHGVARQDIESSRSHTNPLFTSRTSDTGRVHTPTKTGKECKENREKQEQWKAPVEKAQYSGKTLSTTPGKTARTTPSMRFSTPPKPMVKRKILAENREFTATPSRIREEEMKKGAVAPLSKREVITESAAVQPGQKEDSQCQTEAGLTSCSSDQGSGDPGKPKSPLASIEELQKRIQKFLQDEGTSAEVSVPLSPIQCTDRVVRSSSGVTGDDSCVTGVEEAPYHPVFAPYSPRPEFLRGRKSPTSVSLEGNVSPPGGNDSLCQENTPTYDPKNNFLSPRPQFLRYRPLRRLEVLRKSAEGLLGDLDLESPATDADSSRVGSEKEDIESQDVCQEVQSLKSSSESPHLKSSSSSQKEFQPTAEHDVEVTEKNFVPTEQNFDSVKHPEVDAEVEIPCCRLESEDVQVEGEEEWSEDAESNSSSSALMTTCGIVALLALVALILVVSGSPALLPMSLHENQLSHLWKTSKATKPVREFLQTTEGLWAEDPSPSDYSGASPIPLSIRAGYVHFRSFIQSAELDHIVKTGNVLSLSCMRYGARLGQYVTGSYKYFKALLGQHAVDWNNPQIQDANEWDWVPEYDFVVPDHMFDPVEAYENIMARRGSREAKSFWSSVIQSPANHRGAKSVTGPLREEATGQNLDTTSGNFSQCVLTERNQNQVVSSFRPSAPLGIVFPDPVVSRHEIIELDPSIPVDDEEKVEIELRQRAAAEPGLEEDCTSQAIPQSPVMKDARLSLVMEGAGLAPELEEAPLSNVEEFRLSHVQDVQQSESALNEDQPFSSHGGLDGQFSGRDGDPSGLSVQSSDLNMAQETQRNDVAQDELTDQENDLSQEENVAPSGEDVGFQEAEENQGLQHMVGRTPRRPSSLLQKLRVAPSFPTTAAFFVSLVLVLGAALLAFYRGNVGSRNDRPADVDVSRPKGFSVFPTDPPRTEFSAFQSLERSPGSNYFAGDVGSPDVQLSSDFVERFSAPSPATLFTPERLHNRVSDGGFLSLEKSFKHVTDGDSLDSPILEDSSLGRFTALVPVVHNEGTGKEQVKLTPVRRSSRIRTRMQSPCNSMHSSHHLCSCERDGM